ncbi:unnamed protein product [Rotaria socialis]|uniref:ubiquitinyl hydrolase 1 n=1 Tax=Rotaria socialis TaxID=392032 RepID=A0A820JI93_9BILA|nr:unnamed protein product [Rotaria socialis]CAF4326519.1 unnamed protein product [Rotaria socialis]
MWLLSNVLFEFTIYLIVDNITKFILINTKKENRFDVFLWECLFLGFSICFITVYHHTTFILTVFLLLHIIGILHTEKRLKLTINRIKLFIHVFLRLFQLTINCLYNFISNYTHHYSSSKVLIAKKLPEKYLYSYHLKLTNDLRLQQSSLVQLLPRPGILKLHETTCSLNILLQSLASLNSFYSSLQRNINLSRFNYDPIVSTFLDLISQLRANHHTTEYKHANTLVGLSSFISKLSTIYPDLLTKPTTPDIAELFQCITDALNQSLSKQKLVYSKNVIGQVHNQKLTTLSLDFLNRMYIETEAQLHNKVTVDNIDAQTSYIIQYIDLTWLLHHIQLGSILKHTFSGQLLHAYCCNKCSHVRFCAEPFQILILPVSKTTITLEQLLSQLTKIEDVDSISCSYCSSQTNQDLERKSTVIKNGTILTKTIPTLSPLVNTHIQPFDQAVSSTANISIPLSTHTSNLATSYKSDRMKCQTLIANFPSILRIQLKRLFYDPVSRTTTKLNTNIIIEPEKILDLSHIHYTTWLGLIDSSMIIPARYQLTGICLNSSNNFHSSSMNQTNSNSKQYVCLYRTDNSQWFLSDNEHKTEINEIDNICRTLCVTENCYLLFYERCS